MSPKRLLLAGCEEYPQGSRDTPLLRPALEAAGFEVLLAPWTDPERARPEDYDLCLLHTTWDYAWMAARFATWTRPWGERLVNPLPLVNWNSHKGYLADLEAAGVPVIPTRQVRAGEGVDLAEIAAAGGWSELVVKPAVGQTARETRRASLDQLPGLQQHAETLLQEEDILVQPFLPSIVEQGEISVVLVEGKCTHAIAKRPADGDWRVQDDFGGTVAPHAASREELDVAQAALAAAPSLPLYGRVDLVRHQGHARVIELELIEPELFLPFAPEAAERLAKALRARFHG